MATRVISTRLQLDGEKEFKQQMSAVNSELRTLKTELNYTETAFRGQANTLEALTEKQRIQKDMVNQQSEKVRALEDALKDAAAVYGENDKRTDSYRQSINKAKTELINMEEQLEKTTLHLQEAQDSTDGVAASIDGFGKEVKGGSSELDELDRKLNSVKAELGYTEAAFRGQANTVEALADKDRLLRKEIEQQAEKVKTLENALDRASDAYGDSSSEAEDLRQSLYKAKKELVDMEGELEDTERYLDEARRSTDKCATSIDGFGKETKGAGNDLDDFQGGIGGLMESLGTLKNFLVGGTVVGGIKEIGEAILDISDSTKEYRSIMGSLEVSSRKAGYTAEETEEAYRKLYGVLGDTQTTATTVANLQAIQLEQKDLLKIIDSVTGAWSTYGDSIPIDGLAESINETIRAGQVTGTFADVINWGSSELETFGVELKKNIEFTELSQKELEKLTDTELADYETKRAQYEATEAWNEAVQDATTAEDKFNVALEACETQSERTQLVLDFLAKQGLDVAGESWRSVNKDIVKANEAQDNMEQAMGRLGDVLSPVADGIRNFGATAINWLADQIEDLIGWVSDAIEWIGKLNSSWTTKGQQRMEDAGYEAYYNEEGLLRYRKVDGSHADGLDFVPFDGYTAELHYGERVMTAVENDALDTLARAVNALESAAHGGQPPAQQTTVETVRAVTIPVKVVLKDHVVGETVTTYQLQQRRANGT